MSTETCDHDDLIDLHVGSPVLPRSSASDVFPEVSDNLIDAELPMLEQKLQIASQNRPPIDTRRTSVDIEDILISIDDDYDVTDAPPPKISNRFFGICDTNTEALDVLKSLDEVLHASLLESEDILNDNDDTQAQQDIEDCLQDLDNYLQAQDSSTCSASNTSTASTSTDDCSSLCTSSQCTTEGQSCPSYNDEESLRKKLRQIEENYTRFLASGCVNRGYVDTETIEGDGGRIRPLSACDAACSEAKKRKTDVGNRPERATVAVVRRERPSLRKGASESRRNRCTSDRTSASFTSAESDSEDIDWSWVQEVNPQSVPASVAELDMERRAHASSDRCTGTVVVEEPPRRSDVASRSEPAMLHEEAKVETAAVAVPLAAGGTWLRSSMRRLRHLRLPSGDAAATAEAAAEPERTGVELNGEALLNRGAIDPPRPLNSTRPVSAPSRLPPRTPVRSSRSRSRETRETEVSHEPGGRARSSSASSRSRRARSSSSSMSSIPSSVDSTPSRTTAASPTTETQEQGNTNGSPRRSCERNRQSDMPEVESPLGHWPNSLSSMMACLGCTLGLFNISRFAILTVHFGMNFIFQFVFLSVVFGLPLFTLQLCLGQQLGAGVIDMWRISPLFQGVGVSLLIAHAFLGLYSIIGVSWMFVFFRDSFITKMDKYRWAEPFGFYRREQSVPVNATFKLTETIPDYFNGVVLQRHHLPSDNSYATIKFQLAFNLAVVWMIVFVSLSKGLRSYGKVIYAFTLLPVFGTFILCAKILGLMPPEYVNVIFPETAWDEFFLNPKSWLAAGQETFLTWGLLGAAIMQIASHNKHKHLLQRDSSLVAVITFTVLMLVAFLANTCVQILRSHGYSYLPSSFERMSSYTFLRSAKDPLPLNLASTKVRHMVHQSFIVGDRILKPNVDITMESGYQVLRLATELVPATFAVMGSDQVSPFWAVLFYFILIMFGIAQQLAIWHCVITGIMAIKAKVLKSWETTITFFSCACGFILGLPMATELGIYVVYFFDYTIGGIWWLVIVILMQIIAVFMVRGRPYSGDTVVTALFYQSNHPCFLSWIPPLLSFTWNVILPVALMVLCIATFKNGSFRDMFIWHHAPVAEYWPLWARQIGSMMQLLPILCIPLVAVIQSYRYLNNGPNDILDRIQLLYRPPIGEHMDELAVQEAAAAIHSSNQANALATEDPPPKYTPPPSYTTATGARLAKYLRQSIRRSVRRIANVLGESSNNRHRSTIVQAQTQLQPPPPDYNAVLVEMNNTNTRNDVSIAMPDVTDSTVRVSTLERLRNLETTSTALTAAEVASILRSSFRRSTIRNGNNVRNVNFTDSSLSARNLVDSAAPIGETSLVMEHLSSDIENKFNNNTSVI